MLRGQATALFLVAVVVVALNSGTAHEKAAFAAGVKGAGPSGLNSFVAQAPNYIPWYGPSPPPWPTPITGANAGIEGAFAAGNIYNSGAGGTGSQSGLDVLNTAACNFLCFGKRGTASVRVLIFGNDYDSESYTEIGAPDACSPHCPGQITNEAFGLSIQAADPAPTNAGHFLAVDGRGELGVASNIAAGGAVIAGAGDGTPSASPYPSPNFGLLVSRTGTGQGDVLLGSSGSGNYVKCDYGETTPGSLTCGAPLWSVSTGSVAGPVPPCYQNGGTSCNSTFHSVKNTTGLTITTSGACSNNTWCSLSGNTIALSSSAVFSDTYYACALSSSSTTNLSLTVNAQTTSSFTISGL